MRRSVFRAVATSLLSCALAFVSPAAHAHEASSSVVNNAPTINQGDRIATNFRQCQVGYVDAISRTFYIARHCVGDSQAGEAVYKGNQPVGFTYDATDTTALESRTFRDDVIAIRMYATTKVGTNEYSTDAVIPYDQVNVGDKVCARSRMAGRTNCGVVTKKYNAIITIATDNQTIRGDSGGPAWLVDDNGNPRGLIGVSSYFYETQTEHEGQMLWKSGFPSLSDMPCSRDRRDLIEQGGCGPRLDGPGQLVPSDQKAPHTSYLSSEFSRAVNHLSSDSQQGDAAIAKDIGALVSIVLAVVGVVAGLTGAMRMIAPYITR